MDNFPQQFPPYSSVKGRSKYALLGVLGVIVAIVAAVVFYFDPFAVVVNLAKVRAPYDFAYVDGGAEESGKIWLRIDEFTPVTVHDGNSIQMGKRYGSKRFLQVYDASTQKLLNETVTYDNYDVAAPLDRMFSNGASVWIVNGMDKNHSQSLQVFDGASAKLALDTATWEKDFPELASGIAEITLQENPLRLQLLTKDGQKLWYYFDIDRLFESAVSYQAFLQESAPEYTIYFMLSGKTASDLQKKIYQITQQTASSSFKNYPGLASALDNPERLENSFDVTEVASLLEGKIFIEATIIYSDDAALLVMHKAEAGQNGDYVLTYIQDGKEMWTVTKAEVPVLAQLNPSFNPDPFLQPAKATHAQKDGETFVLTIDRVGIAGLDMKNGQQLWLFDAKEGKFL